jgi:hypothetical protein
MVRMNLAGRKVDPFLQPAEGCAMRGTGSLLILSQVMSRTNNKSAS